MLNLIFNLVPRNLGLFLEFIAVLIPRLILMPFVLIVSIFSAIMWGLRFDQETPSGFYSRFCIRVWRIPHKMFVEVDHLFLKLISLAK